jgi:hypothetical protein
MEKLSISNLNEIHPTIPALIHTNRRTYSTNFSIFREAENVYIRQNISNDSFHDHNAFSYEKAKTVLIPNSSQFNNSDQPTPPKPISPWPMFRIHLAGTTMELCRCILSSVGVDAWLIRRVPDWMNWIDTLFTQLRTTGNKHYCWSTHFTLHRYTRTRVHSLH